MRLENTEAAEVLVLHRCLDETVVMDQVWQLVWMVHPDTAVSSRPPRWSVLACLRMHLRMSICVANLVWLTKQLLISHVFYHGRALLRVERLSAIWLNILGVHKALHDTVSEASVSNVLEAWKGLLWFVTRMDLHRMFALMRWKIKLNLN